MSRIGECISRKFTGAKKMNIHNKATNVDVGSAGEFAGQHFSGAINIPLEEVALRIEEF